MSFKMSKDVSSMTGIDPSHSAGMLLQLNILAIEPSSKQAATQKQ